jgi:hypothetical protein
MSEPARLYDHPVLGTFDLFSNDWWRTQSTVPLGETDQVILYVSAIGDPDVRAERFDEAAGVLGRLDPGTLRRAVAEAYLDLYNDLWSEDEEDLDHDGFCARIKPTSVDVDEEGGGVTIYFDDGGLFRGHTILMELDALLQPDDFKLGG